MIPIQWLDSLDCGHFNLNLSTVSIQQLDAVPANLDICTGSAWPFQGRSREFITVVLLQENIKNTPRLRHNREQINTSVKIHVAFQMCNPVQKSSLISWCFVSKDPDLFVIM